MPLACGKEKGMLAIYYYYLFILVEETESKSKAMEA